jgi:hypothetical protein
MDAGRPIEPAILQRQHDCSCSLEACILAHKGSCAHLQQGQEVLHCSNLISQLPAQPAPDIMQVLFNGLPPPARIHAQHQPTSEARTSSCGMASPCANLLWPALVHLYALMPNLLSPAPL